MAHAPKPINVIHRSKLKQVEFTLATGDIFDAEVDAIVSSEQTDFVLSGNPESLSGQTRMRLKKHHALFPPEERPERRRQAARRYRARHAKKLQLVRQLDAILLRQESRRDDVEQLADLLRRLLHPEFINPHSPDDALSFGTDGAIQI
jgi:hypothetical protein